VIILVVGATGLLGGEICSRLSERGASVRALARKTSDGAKVQRLKSLRVKVVEGDLKDRASLEAACRGASTVSRFFYETAGSKDKTLQMYEGHFHDLLNDFGKDEVMADIQSWIDKRVKAA